MKKIIVSVAFGTLLVWVGLVLSRSGATARASAAEIEGDRVDPLVAELKRIGSSVDHLASRVSRIENRRESPAALAASTSQIDDAESGSSDAKIEAWHALPREEKAAREQRAFTRYFGLLDSRRLKERADPEWLHAIDDRARKVVEETATMVEQAPQLTGSKVLGVDCGSTLCRIEAKHDSTEDQDAFQVWFLRGMRSNASLWRQDGRSVVYVAREGHTLPSWNEANPPGEE